MGIYLHWNGGRDSVEGFLTYCKLKEYTSPEIRCGGNWAGLVQVITNFLGDATSVTIDTVDRLPSSKGDNGVYIIKDWEIIDRKLFDGREQDEYDLYDMLATIDEKMPEKERFGEEFIYSEEINTSDLNTGDIVFKWNGPGEYEKGEVVGFSDSDSKRTPYINIYPDENGDYSKNPNNYIKDETVRVYRESEVSKRRKTISDDIINKITSYFNIDTHHIGIANSDSLRNKAGILLEELREYKYTEQKYLDSYIWDKECAIKQEKTQSVKKQILYAEEMINKHTKKVGELTKAEDYVKKQFYKLLLRGENS